MPEKSVTRLSGLRSLDHLKSFHHVSDFRIGASYDLSSPDSYELGAQGGVTLESLGSEPLRTAYIAVGKPELDIEGKIVNAIVINPYYSGDSTWMYYFWAAGEGGNQFSGGPVVGPGELIDTDKYYVIFLDSLGLWGASKPSDGLGPNFPQYSVFDMVQANYRLLVDGLKVGRIRLATGVSNGGTQSYAWAILHPDFVDTIMPIGAATSIEEDPVIRWTFQLMTEAMKSDPVWRNTQGNYYHLPKEQHPNEGMMFGWSIILRDAMSLDHRISMGWEEVRKEVFSWSPEKGMGIGLREKARNYDVNDLLIRNRGQEALRLTPHLSTIKANTLILHVANDLWLSPKPAKQAAELIPKAKYADFESELGHYGLFQTPNIMKTTIRDFFEESGLCRFTPARANIGNQDGNDHEDMTPKGFTPFRSQL